MGSGLAERRRAARALGLLSLLALAAVAVPLAAPGPGLVPAAAGLASPPGWLLGPYGDGFGLGAPVYYALLWVAFAAHLGVFFAAPWIDRRLLRGVAVGLVALFALAPPLLSQDVFSYIDYARLGVLHDLNPYAHAPAARPEDPAYALVGWTDSASAYGPLFTLLTYPLAWLPVAAAMWVLKAAAAAAVLGLALLVAHLAPARGVDPRRGFVIVALNPLVLVQVVGGAHNDAVTMLVALAGCAAVLAAREAAGGFALLAAAAIKVSALFVAPFALLASRPRRFGLGAGVALLVLAAASLLAFGTAALDSLSLVGENQGRVSNYSVPNLLSELTGLAIGHLRAAAIVAYLVLFAGLLAWVRAGGDWIRACGWGALGLLLATAWLLPWYLIWALPFAALSRDGRLIACVLALAALQLAARVPL